ncbi:hypothetical protein [Actinocrispum wychmicini]|uniref:Uncharacterized protein n=1 Tax=Actinocrispum wychmicini TaxID=1213861 RepID=A0A4V2S3F6_9PSEU|nr:hypothetical protein [Actinocrispum wychmicini]TCO44250.1 hypothetical protein EV192_12423 [Actinocrispum wychmicini]
MDDRGALERARASVRELVSVARGGDKDTVFDLLRQVTGDGGPDTRLVVGQLVAATAEMMLLRAGGQPEDAIFAVDLRDEGELAVPIDDLPPPLRAAVRALLAALNDQPRDMEYQLDLALHEQSAIAVLDVVVHCVLWTVGLLEWCAGEGVTGPEWLAGDEYSRYWQPGDYA